MEKNHFEIANYLTVHTNCNDTVSLCYEYFGRVVASYWKYWKISHNICIGMVVRQYAYANVLSDLLIVETLYCCYWRYRYIKLVHFPLVLCIFYEIYQNLQAYRSFDFPPLWCALFKVDANPALAANKTSWIGLLNAAPPFNISTWRGKWPKNGNGRWNPRGWL